MPKSKEKEDSTTKRIKQDQPHAAVTVKWNRSPTLIPAVSSRFPSPLCPRHEFLGSLLALLGPSLFYLGSFLILSPPLLYFVSPRACLTSSCWTVSCWSILIHPGRPFEAVINCGTNGSNLHHNLLLESSKDSTGDKDDDQSSLCKTARMNHSIENDMLAIHAMHHHGVIPIQTFLWMTFFAINIYPICMVLVPQPTWPCEHPCNDKSCCGGVPDLPPRPLFNPNWKPVITFMSCLVVWRSLSLARALLSRSI